MENNSLVSVKGRSNSPCSCGRHNGRQNDCLTVQDDKIAGNDYKALNLFGLSLDSMVTCHTTGHANALDMETDFLLSCKRQPFIWVYLVFGGRDVG